MEQIFNSTIALGLPIVAGLFCMVFFFSLVLKWFWRLCDRDTAPKSQAGQLGCHLTAGLPAQMPGIDQVQVQNLMETVRKPRSFSKAIRENATVGLGAD